MRPRPSPPASSAPPDRSIERCCEVDVVHQPAGFEVRFAPRNQQIAHRKGLPRCRGGTGPPHTTRTARAHARCSRDDATLATASTARTREPCSFLHEHRRQLRVAKTCKRRHLPRPDQPEGGLRDLDEACGLHASRVTASAQRCCVEPWRARVPSRPVGSAALGSHAHDQDRRPGGRSEVGAERPQKASPNSARLPS